MTELLTKDIAYAIIDNMFCIIRDVLFGLVLIPSCFAHEIGVDQRIRYEASRDEHNLPDASDEDDGYDNIDESEDLNSNVLQPKVKKDFIDENIETAVQLVKSDQEVIEDDEESSCEEDDDIQNDTSESNTITNISFQEVPNSTPMTRSMKNSRKDRSVYNTNEYKKANTAQKMQNTVQNSIKKYSGMNNNIQLQKVDKLPNLHRTDEYSNTKSFHENCVINNKLDKVLDKLDMVLGSRKDTENEDYMHENNRM